MRRVLVVALLLAGCDLLRPEAPPVVLPKSVSIDQLDVTFPGGRGSGTITEPVQLGRFVIFFNEHSTDWFAPPPERGASTCTIVARSKGNPIGYFELGEHYLLGRLAGEAESAQHYLPLKELEYSSFKAICDAGLPGNAAPKSAAADHDHTHDHDHDHKHDAQPAAPPSTP